jgi:glycyl-tRNA synthetase
MFGTKLHLQIHGLYFASRNRTGIFVQFLERTKSGRMKIPFGIAQTGKAFRNESFKTIYFPYARI